MDRELKGKARESRRRQQRHRPCDRAPAPREGARVLIWGRQRTRSTPRRAQRDETGARCSGPADIHQRQDNMRVVDTAVAASAGFDILATTTVRRARRVLDFDDAGVEEKRQQTS